MSILKEIPEKEKNSHIPDLISINPEAKKIIEYWISIQTDTNIAKSLLKKINKLSLNPQTFLAAIFFMLFQKAEDLPKELKKTIEEKSEKLFLEAKHLYERILKVNQFPKRPGNNNQVELTIRMFLAVLADEQLLTVFLVLQLHKLEQIDTLPSKVMDETAWTALNIHAPLAGRLGIFWIKSELEDRAFRHLNYEMYQNLKRRIGRKRDSRSESVVKILSKIKYILKKGKIKHDVFGRYKRFYSIFQKLEKVDNNFDRIQDLIAFRIVVNNVDDCYAALSFIHANWTPLKNRFKDYIVKPKPNGYQSIHTTVRDIIDDSLGFSRPVEIQIRTKKMHRMAEFGVAAHWLYKEKRKDNKNINSKKIIESLSENKLKNNFDEMIPIIDLFSENIYVMTPTREIIELPKNSTPIDFAYAIHTDIGNKTIGAKTNGIIKRIDGKLDSGIILEILTSQKQEPKKEWLEFAKTRNARNKIKNALYEKNRELLRKKGFEILERKFKEQDINLNRLIKEGKMEQESRFHKNQAFEHVLFCIGKSSMRSEEVLGWFKESQNIVIQNKLPENQKTPNKRPPTKINNPISNTSENNILVDGMNNVTTRIAKCCSPTEKHLIKGYITKEKVVTIHKVICPLLSKLNAKRIVNVNWSKNR